MLKYCYCVLAFGIVTAAHAAPRDPRGMEKRSGIDRVPPGRPVADKPGVPPTGLRCEFLSSPLGIDTTTVRFNWMYDHLAADAFQHGYRLMVATSLELLRLGRPDVFDSGLKESGSQGTTVDIPQLRSYTRYHWMVIAYGNKDAKGAASSPSWFETAKIRGREGWQAKWISDGKDKEFRPAPLFRKSFDLKARPRSARVYISGLGYSSLYLNGAKVGTGSLDPGYTDYSKRVLYLTYDVTDRLKKGGNTLAAELGNGWFNNETPAVWKYDLASWRARPQLICELRIVYEDGSTDTIRVQRNGAAKRREPERAGAPARRRAVTTTSWRRGT